MQDRNKIHPGSAGHVPTKIFSYKISRNVLAQMAQGIACFSDNIHRFSQHLCDPKPGGLFVLWLTWAISRFE